MMGAPPVLSRKVVCSTVKMPVPADPLAIASPTAELRTESLVHVESDTASLPPL